MVRGSSFLASGDLSSAGNLANSLDPNQNAGPDLNLNCLTLLIVFLKIFFFIKLVLKKSHQTTTKV